MKPTKRTDAIKAKISELWQSGNHNKADVGRKVKRSRSYVYHVLRKANIIKPKKKR